MPLPFRDHGPPRAPFAVLSGLFVGLVFWSSHGEVGEVARSLPGPAANVLHLPQGMILAFLLLRALAPARGWAHADSWPGLRTSVGAQVFALVALHALFNESHQFTVPGRVCALSDVVLDASGAVVFLLVPLFGGRGRSRSYLPAAVLLAAGVALALVAASRALPGDDLLARGLARLL